MKLYTFAHPSAHGPNEMEGGDDLGFPFVAMFR